MYRHTGEKSGLEASLIARVSGQIKAEDLPERLRRCRAAREGSMSFERELLLSALSAAHGNKSEAAKRLRCSRMTLYRRMAKYGIDQSCRSAGHRSAL